MAARLNHTIVWCSDQQKSARFPDRGARLAAATPFHGFPRRRPGQRRLGRLPTGRKSEPIALQHLAFLVGEEEFDGALARVRERTKEIWADPAKQQPGRINHHFGGRGVYFDDPDGHLFEIITKPYGDPADL